MVVFIFFFFYVYSVILTIAIDFFVINSLVVVFLQCDWLGEFLIPYFTKRTTFSALLVLKDGVQRPV